MTLARTITPSVTWASHEVPERIGFHVRDGEEVFGQEVCHPTLQPRNTVYGYGYRYGYRYGYGKGYSYSLTIILDNL